jgi:hypothetical protein
MPRSPPPTGGEPVSSAIEAAETAHGLCSEDHARAGAETARVGGIGRIVPALAPVSLPVEAIPEPAGALETELRLSLQLERQDGAGEAAGRRRGDDRLGEAFEPEWVDDRVVANKCEPGPVGSRERMVTTGAEAGGRRHRVSHTREIRCRLPDVISGRGVVDDEYVDGRTALETRLAHGDDGCESAPQ